MKVYAGDKWKGRDRVICGPTAVLYSGTYNGDEVTVDIPAYEPREGEVFDSNLNKRRAMPVVNPSDVSRRDGYLDVWNGMGGRYWPPRGKGIESFETVVAPGCRMHVTFWGNFDGEIIRTWKFDNTDEASPLWGKTDIPERFRSVKDIVWKWRKVWVGDGYVWKKVRVQVYGWVPFADNISGISVWAKCPGDRGDSADYLWGQDIDALTLNPDR